MKLFKKPDGTVIPFDVAVASYRHLLTDAEVQQWIASKGNKSCMNGHVDDDDLKREAREFMGDFDVESVEGYGEF